MGLQTNKAQNRELSAEWSEIRLLSSERIDPTPATLIMENCGIEDDCLLPPLISNLPEPRHVLELAAALGLTVEQRRKIQAIATGYETLMAEINQEMREAQETIDRVYREKRVDYIFLEVQLNTLGKLRTEQRFAHISMQISTQNALTDEQVEMYQHVQSFTYSPADAVRAAVQ